MGPEPQARRGQARRRVLDAKGLTPSTGPAVDGVGWVRVAMIAAGAPGAERALHPEEKCRAAEKRSVIGSCEGASVARSPRRLSRTIQFAYRDVRSRERVEPCR